MISPQRISKLTAIALATGAIAAPVASAYPPRDGPSQSSLPATLPVNASKPVAYVPRASGQPTGAVMISPSRAPDGPLHARQNTPLVPRSALLPPVSRPALSVPVSNQSSGFDWGDAGIGAAGGLMLSIVAIGGGLALVQRRARRTGTTTTAV